jgi:hypothetical protein
MTFPFREQVRGQGKRVVFPEPGSADKIVVEPLSTSSVIFEIEESIGSGIRLNEIFLEWGKS